MLQTRAETVLKSITSQYIARAVPVSSTRVAQDSNLVVSPATIRNDMMLLDNEGYIIRPHHSAGSIPSDKGYRYYVSTLENIGLPLTERRMISHLFHQVEYDLERWLSLAVTLIAQQSHNVAVATKPKPPACQFKHLELVSLHDRLALAILVLRGIKVRQKLVNLDQPINQLELTATAGKLNEIYPGLSRFEIEDTYIKLPATETQITKDLLTMMQAEDEQAYEEPFLDGFHFLLDQPEFNTGHGVSNLMELVDQRKLVEVMLPAEPCSLEVQVTIGKENKAEAIQDYSVVISRYGLPDEAIGTIGIVGPTRMNYARAISTIDYVAQMMDTLLAELYGIEPLATWELDYQ
jgi:heat-inducible transcriptional repressor